MTRLRKITLRQGQLQAVADVFIRSLLHHRYAGQTMVHFVETLFGVPRRHVVFATAAKSFQLDGETVFEGTRLLFRHDERTPNLFELAILSDADCVSALSAAQWNEIKSAIALTDKKAHHGAERFFGGAAI